MNQNQVRANCSRIITPVQGSCNELTLLFNDYFEIEREFPKATEKTAPILKHKQNEILAKIIKLLTIIRSAVDVVDCKGAIELMRVLAEGCRELSNYDSQKFERNKILEAQMAGIVQLPTYLKLIIRGAPDTPTTLLSEINALQASLGNELVNEQDSIIFDYHCPEEREENVSESVINDKITLVAEQYDRLLNAWIAKCTDNFSLSSLSKMVGELAIIVADDTASSVLWVSHTVLEILKRGEQGSSNEIQLALVAVGESIVQFSGQGSEGRYEPIKKEHFRTMLSAIHGSKVKCKNVAAIKSVFKTDRLNSKTNEEARRLLQGASIITNEEVIPLARDKLKEAMYLLTVVVAAPTEKIFLDNLTKMRGLVSALSGIFSMVEIGTCSAVCIDLLRFIEVVNLRDQFEEKYIEIVKNGLISIESTLDNLDTNQVIVNDLGFSNVPSVTVDAVIGVALADIQQCREAITIYTRTGYERDKLAGCPPILERVACVMQHLKLNKIFTLLISASNYLHGCNKKIDKETAEYRAFTMAIVASQVYLQSIRDGFFGEDIAVERVIKRVKKCKILNTDKQFIFEKKSTSNSDENFIENSGLAEILDDICFIERCLPITKKSASNFDMAGAKCMKIAEAARLNNLPDYVKLMINAARMIDLQVNHADDSVKSYHDSLADLNKFLTNCVELIKNHVNTPDSFFDASVLNQYAQNIIGEVPHDVEKVVIEPNVLNSDDGSEADPLVAIFKEEFNTRWTAVSSVLDAYNLDTGFIDSNKIHLHCHALASILLSFDYCELSKVFRIVENFSLRLIHSSEPVTQDTVNTIRELYLHTSTIINDGEKYDINIIASLCRRLNDAIGISNKSTSQESTYHVDINDVLDGQAELQQEEHPEEKNNNIAKHDDIDAAPVVYFLDEIKEIFPEFILNLEKWRGDIADKDTLKEIKRFMHTIKGSANMCGAPEVGSLACSLEKLFESCLFGVTSPSTIMNELIDIAIEHIQDQISKLSSGMSADVATDLIRGIENYISGNPLDQSVSIEDPAEIVEPEPSDSSIHAVEREVSTPEIDVLPEGVDADSTEDSTGGLDSDEQLEQIGWFLEETEDNLPEFHECLERLKKDNKDASALDTLKHHMHTIKGGSNLCGATQIGALTHSLESLFESCCGRNKLLNDSFFALVNIAVDSLAEMTELLSNNLPLTIPSRIIEAIDLARTSGVVTSEILNTLNISDTAEAIAANERAVIAEIESEEIDAPDEVVMPEVSTIPDRPIESPRLLESIEPHLKHSNERTANSFHKTDESSGKPATIEYEPNIHKGVQALIKARAGMKKSNTKRKPTQKLRVDQSLLDSAISLASESAAQQNKAYNITDLQGNNSKSLGSLIVQLNHCQRSFEIALRLFTQKQSEGKIINQDENVLGLECFNELSTYNIELSEIVINLLTEQKVAEDNNKRMRRELNDQYKLLRDLKISLFSSRLVPFQEHNPKYVKLVNDTALKVGKKVNLSISGEKQEIDRIMLEAISDPITHIIRNAIDHGIESPDARKHKIKPSTGKLTLDIKTDINNIIIEVCDDGAGINVSKVKKKAIEKGIIQPGEEISDNEVIQLITHSGLSTANSVTQISGRGVGMDIVRSKIESLGGSLNIESTIDVGSKFVITLPATMGSNRSLVCRVADELYAIPISVTQNIINVNMEELDSPNGVYVRKGLSYYILELSDALAMPYLTAERHHKSRSLILCEFNNSRYAIVFDELVSYPEIYTRKPEGMLGNIQGISGAAEISDGRLIYILDLPTLIRANVTFNSSSFQVNENRIRPVKKVERNKLVLIVDDSAAIRKRLNDFMEGLGYETLLARDGLHALDLMKTHRQPDVIFIDIEMPNMDGPTFGRMIRDNEDTANVPIIMITSLTDEKIKTHVLSIGVNYFLPKPVSEASLINALRAIFGN